MEVINKTYVIDASRASVYKKWISNDTVIPPAVKMDITPEVGGKYGLVSRFGETEFVMEGYFQEVISEEKLVYTWEWNKDGHESLVTVLFSDEGEQTRIDVTHAGLENEHTLAMHSQGWDSYAKGFAELVLADENKTEHGL